MKTRINAAMITFEPTAEGYDRIQVEYGKKVEDKEANTKSFEPGDSASSITWNYPGEDHTLVEGAGDIDANSRGVETEEDRNWLRSLARLAMKIAYLKEPPEPVQEVKNNVLVLLIEGNSPRQYLCIGQGTKVEDQTSFTNTLENTGYTRLLIQADGQLERPKLWGDIDGRDGATEADVQLYLDLGNAAVKFASLKESN